MNENAPLLGHMNAKLIVVSGINTHQIFKKKNYIFPSFNEERVILNEMAFVSILREFERKGLNYTASSSSTNGGDSPYNVFQKSDKYFHSLSDAPNQWWQIKFAKRVTLFSYFISETRFDVAPTNWLVNVSKNGASWETVHTKEKNIYYNNENFTFTYPISCKFLRIIMLKNSYSTNENHKNKFILSYFDCFGDYNRLQSILNQNRKDRFLRNMMILVTMNQLNS